MADEETDTWTSTSPPQQNDDVGGQQLPAISEDPSTHLSLYVSAQGATLLQGAMPPVSTVPPQGQAASYLSHFAGNAALAQPLSGDQVISGSRGSGLAQASNASAREFLKRCATQRLPTSPLAVRGKTDRSVPAPARAARPPRPTPAQTNPLGSCMAVETPPHPVEPLVTQTRDLLSSALNSRQTMPPTDASLPFPEQTARPRSHFPTGTTPPPPPPPHVPSPGQIAGPATGTSSLHVPRVTDLHRPCLLCRLPLMLDAACGCPRSHFFHRRCLLYFFSRACIICYLGQGTAGSSSSSNTR